MSRVACAAAGLAGVLAGLGGCHKATTEAPDAAVDAAVIEAEAPEAATLAPARCTPSHEAFAVGDPSAPADVEVGDAVPFPGGTAVGLVRRTPAGRVAAVGVVDAALGGAHVVDLGVTLGDAPPPRVAWVDPLLVAAAYALPAVDAGAAGRGLSLYVVDPSAGAVVIGSVPQHRDDSLAFDAAFSGGSGLVVWDEAVVGDASAAPRGVIRAANLAPKQHTRPQDAYAVGQTFDVSPGESDAELPRVVSTDRGFDVIWIARGAEVESDADGASPRGPPWSRPEAGAEVTGEPRTRGWVERVALDKQGKVIAPAKRLTPASGHVSAFDVWATTDAGRPALLVVARDDGELVDGSGGALLRVRIVGDAAESTLAFATDGLGRGAPTFVDSPRAPWLAWIGPHEESRLLPLDAAGIPAGLPSHEEALDEGRPLAIVGGGTRLLVATPADSASQLRVLSCAR
jgi:hypothetical protein